MLELVSVVIITYKRPIEILNRAICSVLRQDYEQLEVIVVNDAPEESALARSIRSMIESLNDRRVVYYEHEKNMGANHARNTGLRLSHGKYVAFLDDDDEWLPNKIKYQVAEMQNSDSVGLVGCEFYINNGGTAVVRKTKGSMKSQLESIIVSNFIGSTSFPLLRKDAIDKVGAFDVTLKACQEYELWIRLLDCCECRIVEEPLGMYYWSKDSTFKTSAKFAAADQQIMQKHSRLFDKYAEASFKHCTEMYLSMLRAKDWMNAKWYKQKAKTYKHSYLDNLTIVMIVRKVLSRKAKRGKE